MLNPVTVQILAQTHKREQRELWKQAEVRRIVRQMKAAQPEQPGPVERIVDGVGTLMIEIGGRLAKRQAVVG